MELDLARNQVNAVVWCRLESGDLCQVRVMGVDGDWVKVTQKLGISDVVMVGEAFHVLPENLHFERSGFDEFDHFDFDRTGFDDLKV